MKVADILRVKGNALYTVTPEAPLVQEVAMMAEQDIGSVVVVEYGELVGVVGRARTDQGLDQARFAVHARRGNHNGAAAPSNDAGVNEHDVRGGDRDIETNGGLQRVQRVHFVVNVKEQGGAGQADISGCAVALSGLPLQRV